MEKFIVTLIEIQMNHANVVITLYGEENTPQESFRVGIQVSDDASIEWIKEKAMSELSERFQGYLDVL